MSHLVGLTPVLNRENKMTQPDAPQYHNSEIELERERERKRGRGSERKRGKRERGRN